MGPSAGVANANALSEDFVKDNQVEKRHAEKETKNHLGCDDCDELKGASM